MVRNSMMWHNNIFVFDDIITLEKQEKLKSEMLSNDFSWYYKDDVTNADLNNYHRRPGFGHVFYADEKQISSYHKNIIPIIMNSCSKIEFHGERRILQGRAFLQLPLNIPDRDKLDVPHIDLSEFKHLVILYYVTDADGETVIYDNQYDEKGDVPRFDTLKEKQRVMPKQGRVVLFDGFYWHTAAQPSKGVRCIINYNVI